jgi:hypothetical protein
MLNRQRMVIMDVAEYFKAVVFNRFCSRTPRYNFSSTLYPKVVGV